MRLLVVVAENDPQVAAIPNHTLSLAGYMVRMASDGATALALLEELEQPADLLVADIRMPGLAGDALGARARGGGLALAVLYITGDDMDPETAYALGRVLAKPFTPTEFMTVVRQVLAKP